MKSYKVLPQKYVTIATGLEALRGSGQRALLSCTANVHFLASLTQGHTKQQNSMGHPVLNPGKHHITGVNLQSFLLQEQSGKLRLFQITCCAYLLAVNYPQLRHLAILQESKIIAGWVESVKTGSGRMLWETRCPHLVPRSARQISLHFVLSLMTQVETLSRTSFDALPTKELESGHANPWSPSWRASRVWTSLTLRCL